MGIHIIPYIVGERIEYDYGDKMLETKEYRQFDSVRQVGDSDFVFQSDFEWKRLQDNPDKPDYERDYRRPKNIDTAIKWINKNIPTNSARLIQLMEDMKANPNLYITISY
jgi:hypothetical protein